MYSQLVCKPIIDYGYLISIKYIYKYNIIFLNVKGQVIDYMVCKPQFQLHIPSTHQLSNVIYSSSAIVISINHSFSSIMLFINPTVTVIVMIIYKLELYSYYSYEYLYVYIYIPQYIVIVAIKPYQLSDATFTRPCRFSWHQESPFGS